MSANARVSGFQPSVNGLHFSNSFPHEPDIVVEVPPFGRIPIGDASNGLCGGMVFTVRDVFETPGMVPLPDANPPAPGTPLFEYLVDRVADVHVVRDRHGYLTVKGVVATQPAGSGFRTGLTPDTVGTTGIPPPDHG